MPSNLDILATSDFARNPFLETIVRRIRGDHTRWENVEAVVEIDSVTTQSVNSRDGGLDQQSDRNEVTRGAMLEVSASQETHPDDVWEFAGTTWKAVGKPIGEDAATKTITVRDTRRQTGRQPKTNTRT